MDFRHTRILVIGDCLLDRYISGTTKRISPEAPVPVLLKTGESYSLGGAANVAHNCRKLGCQVDLFGFWNPSPDGLRFSEMLKDAGINFHSVSDGRPLTVKTRLVSHHGYQIARYDVEETMPISRVLVDSILDMMGQLNPPSAIILSDYKKGMLSDYLCGKVIASAKTPVLVDPKWNSWERYSGAFCITPNLDEFMALGMLPYEIITKYKIGNLLVKRGPEGMILYDKTPHAVEVSPDKPIPVRDVSGAGDSVVAALAACIGSGMNIRDAVPIANKAGGLAVQKPGVQPVEIGELFE